MIAATPTGIGRGGWLLCLTADDTYEWRWHEQVAS